MKTAKKMIKIELAEITHYTSMTLDQLEKLKQPDYSSYTLEGVDYYCDCYENHCNCSKMRVVFYGHRLESDAEYQKRIADSDTKTREAQLKKENQERALLKELKQRYPNDS